MQFLAVYCASIITQIFSSTNARNADVLVNTTVEHDRVVPSNRGRIMGGEVIDIGRAPWQVFVTIRNGSKKIFCGGSLIGAHFVLTAAHCFPGITGVHDIWVIYGASYHPFNTPVEYPTVKVRHVAIPRLYTNAWNGYDIAILLLAQDVQLSKNQVEIIQMADVPATDRTLCHVSGFGMTNGYGAPTNVLRAADVRILDQNQCIERYGKSTPAVYENLVFCTLPKYESHRAGDTCSGDSGGPLICLHNGKYVIQGITSFGTDNCTDGVYTNIIPLRGWVLGVMKEISHKLSIEKKAVMQQQNNRLPKDRQPIRPHQNSLYPSNPTPNNRPWNNLQQNYRPSNNAALKNPSQNIPQQNNQLPYNPNQNKPLRNNQWQRNPVLTNSQQNSLRPNVQVQHNSFLHNQWRSIQ